MPEQPSNSAEPPRRILVIDDDEAVRTMLVRVLSEAGYLAVPAASGAEAVRMFCRFDFDLALLDLGMPGEDGWTTLTQLHAYDAEFPVIIITAWPHQQAMAWSAGAVGCFEKPLDFAELLGAIGRLLHPAPEASSHSRARRDENASGPAGLGHTGVGREFSPRDEGRAVFGSGSSHRASAAPNAGGIAGAGRPAPESP